MKWWRRLKRWEIHFERAPKKKIITTLVLLFGVSMALGYTLSFGYSRWLFKKQVSTQQEIKIREKQDLDNRIKTLQTFRYEQATPN